MYIKYRYALRTPPQVDSQMDEKTTRLAHALVNSKKVPYIKKQKFPDQFLGHPTELPKKLPHQG
jgi:hypothetical protein